MRRRIFSLPCGNRECPLCPVPRLAQVDDGMVRRIVSPPMDEPQFHVGRIGRTASCDRELFDLDGASASWGIAVRVYEGG